jgi:hypothetical protein
MKKINKFSDYLVNFTYFYGEAIGAAKQHIIQIVSQMANGSLPSLVFRSSHFTIPLG